MIEKKKNEKSPLIDEVIPYNMLSEEEAAILSEELLREVLKNYVKRGAIN